MAFITSEQVKDMRNMIKKAFPASKGWKWSVTKEHHSSVNATLVQFPAGYDFAIKREGQDTSDDLYTQLNYYYLDESGLGKREVAVMKKVNEILHTGHWDKSDIQTDYFNCAHYMSLHIGKWDKPAVQAPKKVKKVVRKAAPKKVVPTTVKAAGSEREFLSVAAFIGIQF